MADRTTKIILILIAAGLWANATSSFLHTATAATNQDMQFDLDWMRKDVNSIAVNVTAIAFGLCENRILCSGKPPQSK